MRPKLVENHKIVQVEYLILLVETRWQSVVNALNRLVELEPIYWGKGKLK